MNTSKTTINPVALERFYTTTELAALWKLSRDTIIRMFRDEPGVLKLSNEGKSKRRRDYVTLRVPESVVVRVYNQRSE